MNFIPGDIFACYSYDLTGICISLATSSLFCPPRLMYGPSHVAIAAEYEGQMLWFESTSLLNHRACLIGGEPFKGVQCHLPQDRIDDYTFKGRGHVDVYRVAEGFRLDHNRERHMTYRLVEWIRKGTGYDNPGAVFSGSRVWQATRLFPYADLEKMFCSEMLAQLLKEVGLLGMDNNPSRYNPARLMRRLMTAGNYEYVGAAT